SWRSRSVTTAAWSPPAGSTAATACGDPDIGKKARGFAGTKRGGKGSRSPPVAESLRRAARAKPVRPWAWRNGRGRAGLNPNAAELRCVAVSPDGSLIAAGTRYGLVKVWDIIGRQEKATLRGHTGDVWSVAFSADGTSLATADGEWDKAGTVRLWDLQTW